MQRPRRLHPRSNMNPLDHRLFRELNNALGEINAGMALLSRGRTPDQAQTVNPTPPLIDDHGNLKGLVPVLDTSLNITDMNDDHSQYALLFGRPNGQELFGSRPGTPTSWVSAGTFSLAFKDNSSSTGDNGTLSGTTWSSISVDTLAPAATGIFLVLSTHTANSLAGGSTNYHTTFADSQTNTWTKLGEYTYNHGVSSEHVSVWFCLVTNVMTPGLTTLTATFSTTDHIRASLESYSFTMAAGLSVSVVASTTDGSTISAPAQTFPSLTLAAQSGETLYLRAIAVQPNSGGTHVKTFTPTAGFTAFATDHTDSTNTGAFSFSQACRAEFRVIGDTGPTSAPLPSTTIEDYYCSSLYLAIQINASVSGYLLLGSANLAQAATLEFNGKTLKANFDQFLFRAPGSTTTLSYIDGTTGAFVGPWTPTSDLHMNTYAIYFGASDQAKVVLSTDLVVNASFSSGTGAFSLLPTIRASGNYAARQNILKLGHSALSGGTSNTTAATVALGTGLATDAGLAASQFGMAQGLDLTVTNTNTTKAGNPKTAAAPYALSLTLNAETNTIPQIDTAALRITGTYTTVPSNTFLLAALYATVTGNSTSIGAVTGVQGCVFKAANSTTAAGDARGFTGYGDLSNGGATSKAIGVFGYGTLSGNSTNAQAISFFCDTVAPNDSRQNYDIIGQHIAIHGALWLTTTTNLKSSNPSTHLTLATATSTPNHDLFVSGQGEIDDTFWFDKVGDAIVLAQGGNIVLQATTGTKIGTGTTQKLGFWNAAPIAQPAALTAQLTTLTFTAPGTPDYAIADLVDSGAGSAFGFSTKDEGNTVLSVIANLQTRVAQLEAALSAAAGGSGLIA